jgi:hypothetical protein
VEGLARSGIGDSGKQPNSESAEVAMGRESRG